MVEEGGFTDLSKILKGKKPVMYRRVSSAEQAKRGGGLLAQKKEIEAFLKLMKIKKKPLDFKEQISGGKAIESREAFNEMVGFILDAENPADYFIVMRDFTRWARHVIYGPTAMRALYDAGVEVVSVVDNASTGTRFRPDSNGIFLYGLWNALGGRELAGIAEKSLGGVKVARAKGRIGGQPIKLEKPWGLLVELYPQYANGEITLAEMTRKDPMMTRGWLRKSIQRIADIDAYGMANDEPDAINQWLEVVEALIEAERKYGKDDRRFRALRTATSGFVQKPVQFWSFKPSKSDIADIILNPEFHLAKYSS